MLDTKDSPGFAGMMNDQPNIDAILLAAGFGARMRPLSETCPKPLLEIAGQSLLARVVDNCRREGISKFAINAHYLADQIDGAMAGLRTQFDGCEFAVSDERDQLRDTGGGAKKALELIGSDPVLVGNTDAFWSHDDKPIARMAEMFAREPNSIVLLCVHPARAHGFSRSHDFCLDPMGRITLDTGAPVIYAGMALLGRNKLAGMREDVFSMNVLFEQALDAGLLSGVQLASDWYHVGDPEALGATEQLLAARP